MPYRHANIFVGLTLVVIVAGFYGSYFTKMGEVPFAFHVHAFTATAWVALLMAQVWSIQNRKNALHKTVGKASFFMFPLLIVGFMMIINHTAHRYETNDNPVTMAFGASFGIGMALAIFAYLLLYYLALKNRRNVRLHAGYMLMTPAVLFESPFSRILLDYAPWAIFTGSGFPQVVMDSIVISMALVVVFCLALYVRFRAHGAPFLLTAGLITVQGIIMYAAPSVGWLRDGFAAFTHVPPALSIALALGLGAGAAWLGWRDGGAPKQKPKRAFAPAE